MSQRPFLKQVVQHLYDQHDGELSSLAIVLPSQRAAVFLRQYIAEQSTGPQWLPDILSIESFVSTLADVAFPTPSELLLDFYQVYASIEKEDAQPFDAFMQWAAAALRDFDEIDFYVDDPNGFFGSLSEIKAIEQWNPGQDHLTDMQAAYLGFWERLPTYFWELRDYLRQKRKMYPGQAYRYVADVLQGKQEDNHLERWLGDRKRIYFAGFNAFSLAGEAIVKHLVSDEKASVLWDTDEYYMNAPEQEAGHFLRSYKKHWPAPFLWQGKAIEQPDRKIRVVGMSGRLAQVRWVGAQLATLSPGEYERTAVVLADEQLLIPLLGSLPPNIEHLNVTMGYPLAKTQLHSFWNSLLLLYERAQETEDGTLLFLKEDLLVLVDTWPMEQSGSLRKQLQQRGGITLSNTAFVQLSLPFLADDYHATVEAICTWKRKDPQALVRNMQSALTVFCETTKAGPSIEKEYLFAYSKVLAEMMDFVKGYDGLAVLEGAAMMRTLRTILNGVVGLYPIPFYGEPLRGLQVMGMLETRTLDFDRVYLVGANEEVLPRKNTSHSFIPYDLRKSFEMPTQYERDAIYAYHFYRLLQRSKEFYLVYNEVGGPLGGGEPSRFITQLLHEYTASPIAHEHVSWAPPTITPDQPVVSRDGQANGHVLARMERGISPSMLSTYINCPLDFYMRYALGMQPDQIHGAIGADVFGTVLHHSMESLFRPFVTSGNAGSFGKETWKDMRGRLKETVAHAFTTVVGPIDSLSGKYHIAMAASERLIAGVLSAEQRFFDQASQQGVARSVALEESITATINANGKAWTLRGTVDRIDRVGGAYTLVDYKSAAVSASQLRFDEVEELFHPDKRVAFQLMVYLCMLQPEGLISSTSPMSAHAITQASVRSFKQPKTGHLPLCWQKQSEIPQAVIVAFSERLAVLIEEILNGQDDFLHRDGSDYCSFCL